MVGLTVFEQLDGKVEKRQPIAELSNGSNNEQFNPFDSSNVENRKVLREAQQGLTEEDRKVREAKRESLRSQSKKIRKVTTAKTGKGVRSLFKSKGFRSTQSFGSTTLLGQDLGNPFVKKVRNPFID